MSFALLADSGSEDLKELLKKANAKETKAPEAVAAPAQQQKPKSAGKKEDRPASQKKPRSDDSGDAIEGGRPQRGGRGGRGRGQKHHGYVPPKRGFEHDRSVSRTGRGKEVQKGGQGKFNWGKEGEEAQVAADQTNAETPKEETQAAEAPAAAEKKVEEEKDDSVTYEEFKKQQAEKKKAIEALVSKAKSRESAQIKYDTSIAKYVEKPVEKKAEDAQAAEKPAPKKAEEKSSGPVTLTLQELLKDQPIKYRRDNREFRGRGGRGGRGRGGRGGNRAPRQAPAPEFNAKDFPSLKL